MALADVTAHQGREWKVNRLLTDSASANHKSCLAHFLRQEDSRLMLGFGSQPVISLLNRPYQAHPDLRLRNSL